MVDEYINKTDKIDLASCSVKLGDDRIVRIDFKKIDELTINDVMEIVNTLKEISQENKYPTLITVKQFMSIDKDVRELWADTKRSKYSIADAMVVSPVAVKMIANFYISINKPSIPTRVFNSEEMAFEWLRTF